MAGKLPQRLSILSTFYFLLFQGPEPGGCALELRAAVWAAEIVGASGVIGVRRAGRFICHETVEVAPVPTDETMLLGRFRGR